MALLWKKKKKLDPSQARKACSGQEDLLSPCNPSCGSPGEQALFRLQCYRWELPQRRNLLQPWGKVLRLDFSRLWLNRWEAAMLHWRDLSVVCCPRLLKPAEDRPGEAGLPGEGSEGWPDLSYARWQGVTAFVCVFRLGVRGWVFPPGLPCRGGRKNFCSGKFQGTESGAWARRSCRRAGHRSPVPSAFLPSCLFLRCLHIKQAQTGS